MKRLIIFLVLLLPFFLKAQDTLTLSLAIEKGLQNNYRIRIAQKQVEIDRNNNAWGAAGLFPALAFTTNLSGSTEPYQDTLLAIESEQALTLAPALNLNWVLFDGFSVQISKSRLAWLQQQSEGNAAIQVENTLQSILLAYQFALLQKETLEVFTEVKKLSADRYRYVLVRKELGSALTFDVLQAQNNYLSDSANALRQEINYRNSLRNLNLILAEPVETDYILQEAPMEIDREFEATDLMIRLESSNKTLQNQYVNQEILRKNVQQSQSELYPMLSLSAGYGRTWVGAYGDLENQFWDHNGYQLSASLRLSYTLSNGGNVRRAIQNARIREDIGVLQLEEMKQRLYNQLFTILEQYRIRRQLLHVSEARLESARLNLQIGEDRFKSGAINSFNYRDLQLAFQNAALESLQARYNLIDSWTELLRLSGGIVTEFE